MQGNKLDDTVAFMRSQKMDIMAIQDTYIANNTTFNIQEYNGYQNHLVTTTHIYKLVLNHGTTNAKNK